MAAVGRNDAVTIESLVIAAIARASDRATRIVDEAVAVAPQHAQRIVEAVRGVFPRLGERAQSTASASLERLARAPGDIAPGDTRAPSPTTARNVPALEAERQAQASEQATEEAERIARQEATTSRWSGELSLGGSYRTGAERASGLHAGGKLRLQRGTWRNEFDLAFDYNQSNDTTNARRFQTDAKTRRSIGERMYGFGLLEYEDDRFSGFDYQISEAVGIGYTVIDSERFTWDLEVGPSWRQSRISDSGSFLSETFLRSGSEIIWAISDTAELSNETSALYSGDSIEVESATSGGLGDSNDLSNVTALDMTIIGNLVARLSCEITYRPEAPPGGTTTRTLSKITLVHSF
ncbi:MAG: DUF481 domain-containing protein [Acetobacterales bacterium]